uniref:Bromodomain containing 8 n=1 Tax=Sander lucioperca TaxID=283035 RepID=A0A8D0B1Y0_SANLU
MVYLKHKILNVGPTEPWSVREKLCLASSVMRSGDQNWVSVSRAIKPFSEPGRPPDWFSQKHCASQYSELLEATEAPKSVLYRRRHAPVCRIIIIIMCRHFV